MIPLLTIAERAELYGLSYLEQRELEQREPWVRHWSARFDDGAKHLRAWLAAGRPSADRTAVAIVGDRPIVEAARGVLARLPEAAAHWLVTRGFVVCGGVSTKGFVTAMPLAPCDAPILVSLSVADRGIIAHEFAHVWHLEPLPASCRYTAEMRERVRVAFAAEDVENDRQDERAAWMLQRERAADALARAWGFPIDTTTGRRGERRRCGLLRDLAADARKGEPES